MDQINTPPWLFHALSFDGLKEIPGKQHNPTIINWLVGLGAWWRDDETPWCGTFVAHCMKEFGYDLPKHWYRAKDWCNWGQGVWTRVGALGVFDRDGGGHIGFLTGQTDTHWEVFGANQKNAVNHMLLKKERLIACRWPIGYPVGAKGLPRVGSGNVSHNEG